MKKTNKNQEDNKNKTVAFTVRLDKKRARKLWDLQEKYSLKISELFKRIIDDTEL